MENNSTIRNQLRPEAGSLRWCKLNKAQREAFKRIIEMHEETIDCLQYSDTYKKRTGRKGAFPLWFDSSRENRMVLLEGKRGTGKTSVMLSLVHACEDEENQCPKRGENCECARREQGKSQISLEEKTKRIEELQKELDELSNNKISTEEIVKRFYLDKLRKEIVDLSEGQISPEEDLKSIEDLQKQLNKISKIHNTQISAENTKNQREEIEKKLQRLRCRTIWLEPLDMDPLAGSTNLLAAVLARIEDAIKIYIQPSTKADDRRDPCGILELCPDYLEALQQLSRLQANVALAWDGNISSRGGQLDPDSYSMEVRRAENARLTLRPELSATLNDLAKNIPQVCVITNPLFILPVDDLDLNPTRCLEVLRLLRMIDVPRLFILILGDSKMVEAVLELKHTGNFMDVLGVSGSGRLDHSDRKDIKKNAGEVAYNVMRKLLPPGQRIKLENMDVWEALNFRPQGPDSESPIRLHELLARIPIKLDAISPGPKLLDGNGVETLRDFLLNPAPRPANNAEITKENLSEYCCYNAKAVLRMPPRHVADWWFLLQQVKAQEPEFQESKLFDELSRHCRSAIGEDSTLMLKDRQKYSKALRRNPSTGEWELFLGLTSIPETKPTARITVSNVEGASQSIKKEFLLYSGNGWRLYPGRSEILAELELFPIGDTKTLKNELSRYAEQPSFSNNTASALLLFHDLLALGPRWKLMKENILIYRPIELWARTEWKNDTSSNFIFWPVPEFLSSWGYLRYFC
jgi:hypothetical protein